MREKQTERKSSPSARDTTITDSVMFERFLFWFGGYNLILNGETEAKRKEACALWILEDDFKIALGETKLDRVKNNQ